MKVKQEAGRKQLGQFMPEFAKYNDDILFGEVWSDDNLSLKTRSIITVSVLVAKGVSGDAIKYHLISAKKNGVSKDEMASLLTHVAFYAGWPNVWAVAKLAESIYLDDSLEETHGSIFGMGDENIAYQKYFIGKSYLKVLTKKDDPIVISNVTFKPGCRNNWHIHHYASQKVGQFLFVTEGTGWYQEWGKEPQKLKVGDIVEIPANVKHWHGADKDSWFSHIAFSIPEENSTTEWLEKVDNDYYNNLER